MLRIPFINLLNRGDNIYDIAEFPRVIAYSLDIRESSKTKLVIRDLRRRKITIYSQDEKLIIKYEDNDEENNNEPILISQGYIRDYACTVKEYVRLNSGKYSSASIYNGSRIVIEPNMGFFMEGISEETKEKIIQNILNTILQRDKVYVLRYSYSSIEISKISEDRLNSRWIFRTSSIKGILRYALFKLIVLFLIYHITNLECLDKVIIPLLGLLSYILTHDDEHMIFCRNKAPIFGETIKKDILLLHSIIFGSGINKSLIFFKYAGDYGNLVKMIITYNLSIQYSSIFSYVVLSKLLEKFKAETRTFREISIKDLLYGLLCLTVGSLNYISYLRGAFVPLIPRHVVVGKGEYWDRVFIIRLLVPTQTDINKLIELAIDFLNFYVNEYIINNLSLDGR